MGKKKKVKQLEQSKDYALMDAAIAHNELENANKAAAEAAASALNPVPGATAPVAKCRACVTTGGDVQSCAPRCGVNPAAEAGYQGRGTPAPSSHEKHEPTQRYTALMDEETEHPTLQSAGGRSCNGAQSRSHPHRSHGAAACGKSSAPKVADLICCQFESARREHAENAQTAYLLEEEEANAASAWSEGR